jgi:hypothetical protein
VDAQTVASTIQLILAPVVMVTACAIIVSGLLGHYSAINDRLRAMARERFELVRVAGSDALAIERRAQIDGQVPDLLRRHGRVRDAVLAFYSAIAMFIADMFVIAAASATGWRWVPQVALVTFLAGISVMLAGALITVLEVRISHISLHFEIERMLKLGVEPEREAKHH